MRSRTLRSVTWLFAAAASAVLTLGVYLAANESNRAPALVGAILLELVLGVIGYLVFATQAGRPAEHSRGRWAVLTVARWSAFVLMFGYLAALVYATFTGVDLGVSWLQAGLVAPAIATLVCLGGALLEREHVSAARLLTSEQHGARRYETGHRTYITDASDAAPKT